MFGQFNDIITGHLKEALGQNEDLYEHRVLICRKCPLYTQDSFLGEICDSKKYYNTETGELSKLPKPGFINGCGCRLEAKSRIPNASCVLSKWNKY